MTEKAVKQQIETIKKITSEAIKTKESARKILLDAGIIKESGDKRISIKKKK